MHEDCLFLTLMSKLNSVEMLETQVNGKCVTRHGPINLSPNTFG